MIHDVLRKLKLNGQTYEPGQTITTEQIGRPYLVSLLVSAGKIAPQESQVNITYTVRRRMKVHGREYRPGATITSADIGDRRTAARLLSVPCIEPMPASEAPSLATEREPALEKPMNKGSRPRTKAVGPEQRHPDNPRGTKGGVNKDV